VQRFEIPMGGLPVLIGNGKDRDLPLPISNGRHEYRICCFREVLCYDANGHVIYPLSTANDGSTTFSSTAGW